MKIQYLCLVQLLSSSLNSDLERIKTVNSHITLKLSTLQDILMVVIA
jgi:hypothetical protein